MALYIDIKYVSLISSSLSLFKKKDTYLWNFRCPICGDSKTNQYKSRGYIYKMSQQLLFQCKNCSESTTFGRFLEQVNPLLHQEYRMELYKEKYPERVKKKALDEAPEPSFSVGMDRLTKPKEKPPESLLDMLFDRIDQLPDDHEGVAYCLNRKIPRSVFKKIYYLPHICDIVQLSEKYRKKVTGREPRLIFPFYNLHGKLSAVSCRAISDHPLRYVTVKIREEDDLIFGVSDLDVSKTVYVTEGPIDSLFLPNAIAVGSTAMSKIESLQLPKDKIVIIFDNQPRNREICSIINKTIDRGYQVVIWNEKIQEKDINDMSISGIDFMKEITSSTYSGLAAKMAFTKWNKSI